MRARIIGKYGPYPPTGGGTSAYALEVADSKILLDCGTGTVRALSAEIATFSAVIITHFHPDHICDLPLLGQTFSMIFPGKTIPVYAPQEPKAAYEYLDSLPGLALYEIKEDQQLTIGQAKIEFFSMQHPIQTFGVRISHDKKVFAYTGDTVVNSKLPKLLENADCALCDAAFLQDTLPEFPAHMCAKEAAVQAREANVKKLYLTHLPPNSCENYWEQEAAAEFSPCSIVQEGEVIDV